MHSCIANKDAVWKDTNLFHSNLARFPLQDIGLEPADKKICVFWIEMDFWSTPKLVLETMGPYYEDEHFRDRYLEKETWHWINLAKIDNIYQTWW